MEVIEAQRWRELADYLASALANLTEATGVESMAESDWQWRQADDAIQAYREAVAEDEADE